MAKKAASIDQLVRRIRTRIPGVRVVDFWDADLVAIGFARPGDTSRVVYVSTWQMPRGRYHFDCDLGPWDDLPETVRTGTARGVGELAQVIGDFLELPLRRTSLDIRAARAS